MRSRTHVLLLGFAPQHALADRLRRIDFHPVEAAALEDGLRTLDSLDPPARGALVPPCPRLPDLPRSLGLLRERSLHGDLRFLVVGRHPGPRQADALRKAGLCLALWTPCCDGELRFLVNHIVFNPRKGECRLEPRVPTPLRARVLGGPVEKVAAVYSLSVGGAYLETDRPTPVGGEVYIELPLPSRATTIEAVVVSNNVPGNLERERLPRGMGVQFLEIEEATRELLSGYIEEQARSYQL